MALGSDCLQALRDCCRDEAAFERLQEILASEEFERAKPERSTSQSSLKAPDPIAAVCQSSERPVLASAAASPFPAPLQDSLPDVSRSSLLQGVAEATSQLLTRDDYTQAIATALATLGRATGANRVYIFEIHPHPVTGEPAASQRFEWVQATVTPQIDNPALQNCTYAESGLSHCYDQLRAGQSICGLVRDFSPSEQDVLGQQETQSILLIPIQIKDELWGFVGFNDCRWEQQCSPDDEAMLRMMAASIGGAIARQQTEAALRHSEARLQKIAANVPGMIYQFSREADSQRQVLYASSGSYELLEVSPEEIQSDISRIWDLCHPSDRPSFEQSIEQSGNTLQPWNWEGRVITPSGKLKWVQGIARPERQPDGRLLWDGILVDITQRKQAEIEWRQSEARYGAMLDASPDLMFRVSREGQYLDFKGNATADIPREAILGRYAHEMLPAEVAGLCMKAIEQALETGTLQTCEYQLPTPRGPRDYEARLMASGPNEVLTVVQDITDRKQAEENLRASEDRLQSFFEATFEAVVIHDFGTILDVNPAGEALFGYTAAELIGMPVLNLVAPVSKSAVQERWQSLASPDAPYAYEGVGLRQDGSTFMGAVVAKAAHYKGQLVRVAGIRDITAQKQAEAAILQSEARHRALVNAIPDLMFRIRRDGTYLDCKAEQDSYILQRPEDLIGQTVYDVLPPSVALQRMAYIERALATGEDQNFEYQLQVFQPRLPASEPLAEDAPPREQTTIRDYEARIVVSGEDEVLAIVRDITERKQAEQQLWAATERDRLLGEIALRIRQSLDLDQILNTTVAEVRQFLKADRVYIFHTSPQGEGQVVAESIDPVWRSLLGKSIDDSAQVQGLERLFQDGRVLVIHDGMREVQEPWLAAYHHEYHIRAALVMPLMLNERAFGGLCVNQCQGARQWEQFEVDLLERLATQVAIAIQQAQLYQQVQDLNAGLECQVAERTAQLQQKMEELQELNDLKDEFLNAFSHDLRTPVMGMSLVLNNLLNQSGDTLTTTRSIVQRMLQSSEHQLNLINSLLQAHSSETRGIALQYELVQLSLLSRVIVEDLEPLIQKNQAILTNLVPTDLPLVTADPLQLRRVFENLITNALHHNPPGIHLVLEATVEAEMIRFTLSDDGVGMAPEVRDRLFTRYNRGPKSRHSTGIGLGLYLCRQIVTAHGGQIGVNSTVGQGSTFWLTLPLASPSVMHSTPAALADA